MRDGSIGGAVVGRRPGTLRPEGREFQAASVTGRWYGHAGGALYLAGRLARRCASSCWCPRTTRSRTSRTCCAARARAPRRRRARDRRRQPRRHRRPRREARRRPRRHRGAAPRREVGARLRVPRRVPGRARPGLRRDDRDGRRPLARSRPCCPTSSRRSRTAPTSRSARATCRAARSPTGSGRRRAISRVGCLYAAHGARAAGPGRHRRLPRLPPPRAPSASRSTTSAPTATGSRSR